MEIYTFVTLQKTITFAAMALLVAAEYNAIRTFRIPNLLFLAIASLGVVLLVLLGATGDAISAVYAFLMFALIFVIGFLLFSRDWIGGGDVKLLGATILLIRYRDVYEFFVLMAVFGAVLSLAIVFVRNYLPMFVGARIGAYMATVRSAVPYGVAIAAAGVVTLLFQPLLLRYSTSFAPSFLW